MLNWKVRLIALATVAAAIANVAGGWFFGFNW